MDIAEAAETPDPYRMRRHLHLGTERICGLQGSKHHVLGPRQRRGGGRICDYLLWIRGGAEGLTNCARI
eukprot:1121551-Heterocapsa_arctica.AAC.1